jgi:pimeloyl-ACP methyl ester carboxylesterase
MKWLLLRGLGREIEHWDRFPRVFQALGQEIELLDLAGAGTEFQRKAPLTTRETVEDLRARRKSETPVGLVAISLGGMVALDWAARYPEEISRLVIINSSVSELAPPWQRLRLQSLRTGIGFLAARTPEAKELSALQITTGLSGEALKDIVRRWVEIRNQRPVAVINILRQLIAAFRFRLTQIPRCPTLVVKSLQDRLVDPACSDAIAKKMGASIVAHPTAGHDLPLEDPEWLARAIADWASEKITADLKPQA